MGLSRNYGDLLAGVHGKDYSILGSPYLGKLPYYGTVSHPNPGKKLQCHVPQTSILIR